MSKILRISYLGCFFFFGLSVWVEAQDQKNEINREYDPQKGFTPAQRSLTTTFLKLAGSLEAHGDPEIYIRWVVKENTRIDAKYSKVFGDDSTSRPVYLTDDYVANLIGEWRKLEKPLKLEQLSRDCGKQMRFSILGSWHKTPADWASEEPDLTNQQRARFKGLLENKFFLEGKTEGLSEFYADGGGYDDLSDGGKKEMSNRYWLGKMKSEMRKQELARRKGGTIIVDLFNEYQELLLADMKKPGKRTTGFNTLQTMLEKRLQLQGEVESMDQMAWNEKDAIWHSHMVRALFRARFRAVDKKVSKEYAESIRAVMGSMAENLLVFAHLEFMAGLGEKMADDELASR